MKEKLAVSLLVFANFVLVFPARADNAPALKPIIKTVSELLTEGYQIHSVTIIDQATAKRMSGNDSWQDDIMLTLTKGTDFAFCHSALSVTTNGLGLKSTQCNMAQ